MNLSTLEWTLARGAGFTAFVLLTATVTAGLVMSLGLRSRRWPAIVTRQLHQHLTTLSLWMLGLHVVMLVIDTEAGVASVDAAVPLSSDYRPVATGLGVLAMYAVGAVVISTRLRHRIGYRRWRALHFLAFAAYVSALLHGILAGTDTGASWASLVYAASALLVGGLTLARAMGLSATSGRRADTTNTAQGAR